MIPTITYAERPTTYQPPPLEVRLMSALFLLGGAGLLLSGLLLLMQKRRIAEVPRRRARMFAVMVVLFIAIGIVTAANVLSFGEDRNPEWLGSFFLAPILPSAILILQPRRPSVFDYIAALGLTPLFWFALFVSLASVRFAADLPGW